MIPLGLDRCNVHGSTVQQTVVFDEVVRIQGADDDAGDAGVVGDLIQAGWLGSTAVESLLDQNAATLSVGLGYEVHFIQVVGACLVARYGGDEQVLDRVEDGSTTTILDRPASSGQLG